MIRFLLLLLLLAAPLWAQDAPETHDAPPPPDDLLSPLPPEIAPESSNDAPPPAVLAPPASTVIHMPLAAPMAAVAPALPGQGHEPAVAVAPLLPPSAAGFGPLDEKTGGLPPLLWQGSNAGAVTTLLEDAGAGFTRGTITDNASRDIARRVALTHAQEPDGAAASNSFFAARVLLAASAGHPASAKQLLQGNPQALNAEGAERLAAVTLMQGDMQDACADPHIAGLETPFWQKLSVICALGSESGAAKAQLALDVMREAGEPDALFLEIAEAAASGKKIIASKAKPESMHVLHAALLMAGKVQPSAGMLDVLALTPYPLLIHLKAPDAWRAKMALSLARGKWVNAAVLKDIFQSVAIKPEVLAKLRTDPKLLNDEKTVPVSLRTAYALHASTGAELTQQAALMAGLITLLEPQDLAGTLGQLILSASPAPASTLQAYAAPFARLSLLQGDQGAKVWFDLAASDVSLYPLAAVRGVLPSPEQNFGTYAQSSTVPLEQRANAVAAAQALGLPIGKKTEATLVALDMTLPDAVRDRDLEDALQGKRMGEALLRTLLLSPKDAISVLLLKIKTLQALGFTKEARDLALPLL